MEIDLNKILISYFENNIKKKFISDIFVIIITNDNKYYEFYRTRTEAIRYAAIQLSKDKEFNDSLIEESLVETDLKYDIIDVKYNDDSILLLTSDGKLLIRYFHISDPRHAYYLKDSERIDLLKNFIEKSFENEKFVKIDCGNKQYLTLTKDGKVYQWINKLYSVLAEQPLKFGDDNENFVDISCGLYHSLALTKSGKVFGWGLMLSYYQKLPYNLIWDSPNEIKLEFKVTSIKCGLSHSLLLSEFGKVYAFGNNYMFQLGSSDRATKFNLIEFEDKITKIDTYYDKYQSKYDLSLFETEKDRILLTGSKSDGKVVHLEETNFNKIEEAIEYMLNFNKEKYPNLPFKFHGNIYQNGRYANEFMQLEKLGKGSFGKVWLCKCGDHSVALKIRPTLNDAKALYQIRNYAVKIIKLRDVTNEFISELVNSPYIYNLDSKYVLTYYDIWLEFNKTKNTSYLYIQMELCDTTLGTFINTIKSSDEWCDGNILTIKAFEICCLIFIQILNGMNVLHNFNPKIIHRDLNPNNILVNIGNSGEINVKIADFGLAKLHKFNGQTHSSDVGNIKYIAPEVKISNIYDERADIFSIGKVCQEIFMLNNKSIIEQYNESCPLDKLHKLTLKMVEEDVNKRYQTVDKISKRIRQLDIQFSDDLKMDSPISIIKSDINKFQKIYNEVETTAYSWYDLLLLEFNEFKETVNKISHSAIPRLKHELKKCFEKNIPATIINDIFTWEACIFGPDGSPYEDMELKINIKFSVYYPFEAPIITFTTFIIHPNVSQDGVLFCHMLCNWWPTYDIATLIKHIYEILSVPDKNVNFEEFVLVAYNNNVLGNIKSGDNLLENYFKIKINTKNVVEDTIEEFYKCVNKNNLKKETKYSAYKNEEEIDKNNIFIYEFRNLENNFKNFIIDDEQTNFNYLMENYLKYDKIKSIIFDFGILLNNNNFEEKPNEYITQLNNYPETWIVISKYDEINFQYNKILETCLAITNERREDPTNPFWPGDVFEPLHVLHHYGRLWMRYTMAIMNLIHENAPRRYVDLYLQKLAYTETIHRKTVAVKYMMHDLTIPNNFENEFYYMKYLLSISKK